MTTEGFGRATGPPTGSHRARHASGRRGAGYVPWLLAGLAALGLLAVGLVTGMALGSSPDATEPDAGGSAAAPVSASQSSADPQGSPTSLARVTRVVSGDELQVEIAGRSTPVRVLGIDAPDAGGPGRAAECGAADALRFADSRLSGQTVTLVPDPTIPATDDRGRRLAYVVLRTQLSYTDAVLTAGWARADSSRPLWYAPVFAREQADAARAERGLWGEPCDLTP